MTLARITEVSPYDNFYSLRHHFEGAVIDASEMSEWGDHADLRLVSYHAGRAVFQNPPINGMPSVVFLAIKIEEIPEGETE